MFSIKVFLLLVFPYYNVLQHAEMALGEFCKVLGMVLINHCTKQTLYMASDRQSYLR